MTRLGVAADKVVAGKKSKVSEDEASGWRNRDSHAFNATLKSLIAEISLGVVIIYIMNLTEVVHCTSSNLL